MNIRHKFADWSAILLLEDKDQKDCWKITKIVERSGRSLKDQEDRWKIRKILPRCFQLHWGSEDWQIREHPEAIHGTNQSTYNWRLLQLPGHKQVADERFLVLVNDMLSTGEIPNLLPDDEVENVINGVRNEVRSTGVQDTREQCWKFFIERVRRNLKVCCHRNRSR